MTNHPGEGVSWCILGSPVLCVRPRFISTTHVCSESPDLKIAVPVIRIEIGPRARGSYFE